MNKIIMTGAVALGTTLAGAGGAYAAVSATIPSGTIHGCVTGTSRALTHVYTNPLNGTTCASGTQVIWANGPDKDAPITAGPAGLDVRQVVNDATVVFPDSTSADAICPKDHPYVVSGGAVIDDNSASLRDSYPLIPGPGGQFPQGWGVSVTIPAGGRTSATVHVYAVCGK